MKWLLLLWAFLQPFSALAQAVACHVPGALPAPKRPMAEQRRIVPVGGYTLALGWSPEYCRTRQGDPSDTQCGGRTGSFGFILHGLWPDGRGKTWPQYCRPVGLVPQSVARDTLCVTPSVDLQQHEWEKHGSCAFADAAHYFRAGRILYGAIRYPEMEALSRRKNLTIADFAAAFASANPGLRPGMLRIQANRRGWLEEVFLCLDRRMRPRICAAAEEQADSALKIWRGRR